MELRQLRHFQEIVRCASFGQAAEKLHITQPALSKSIRNLERSLGVALLERHPSGVTPTEYGKVFLSYAALVTSELERAVEEINALKGRGRGTVRVGAGAALSRYLLPQTLRLFMSQSDGGSVTIHPGLSRELSAMLRQGEIDVMIGTVSAEDTDPELRREIVLEDEIVVVCDRAHPLAKRRGVTLKELAQAKWILPSGPEAESDRLHRVMRAAKLEGPVCAVRTGSSAFMASLLRDSEYLSYLPRALIQLDHDYAHLVAVNVEEPIWPRVPVGVTYRRRGVMLQSTRRFINRLKDVGAQIQAQTL